MFDAYLLLTPILVLGVFALVRFVGCELVFPLHPPAELEPPVDVVATPGNQLVDISWDPVDGATGYKVQRGDQSGGPYQPIRDDDDAATTSFRDQPLFNGVTKFYQVASKKNNNVGTFSAEVSATPALGFITFKTLGTLRNNFTGSVGMVIQTGPTPFNVVGLGRIFVAGNAGQHILSIREKVVAIDVASVQIDLAVPGVVQNDFVYGILAAPVTLKANTEYYVLSQELDGGDQWFDLDTTVTTNNVATVTRAAFTTDGVTFTEAGVAGNTFGPVDFLF